MNPIITSADQLNWIKPNELPADDYRRIDTEGAYALAGIDDDNLLAIYIDVIDDEGLIPAHAGKTTPASSRCSRKAAHPRSRGENTS